MAFFRRSNTVADTVQDFAGRIHDDVLPDDLEEFIPDGVASAAVSMLGGSPLATAAAGPVMRRIWAIIRRHPKAVAALALGVVGAVAYKRYQSDDPVDSRTVVDDIPTIQRRQPV